MIAMARREDARWTPLLVAYVLRVWHADIAACANRRREQASISVSSAVGNLKSTLRQAVQGVAARCEQSRCALALQAAFFIWRFFLLAHESAGDVAHLQRRLARVGELGQKAFERQAFEREVAYARCVLCGWGSAVAVSLAWRRLAQTLSACRYRQGDVAQAGSPPGCGGICGRAFRAWHRRCVEMRCARAVQLMTDEKNAILRELATLQEDRDRCLRRTRDTMELSFGVAEFAYTIAGGGPQEHQQHVLMDR